MVLARRVRNISLLVFGLLVAGAASNRVEAFDDVCALPHCINETVFHEGNADWDCKEIVEDPEMSPTEQDALCEDECRSLVEKSFDHGFAHNGELFFCTTTWYAWCGCWDDNPE